MEYNSDLGKQYMHVMACTHTHTRVRVRAYVIRQTSTVTTDHNVYELAYEYTHKT